MRPLLPLLVAITAAMPAPAAPKVYGSALADRPLTVPRRSWRIEALGGIAWRLGRPPDVPLAPDAAAASSGPVSGLGGDFGALFEYGITDRLQVTLPLFWSLELGDPATPGGLDLAVTAGLTGISFGGPSGLGLFGTLGLAGRQEVLPGLGWYAGVSTDFSSYFALQWHSFDASGNAAVVWDVSDRVTLALPLSVSLPLGVYGGAVTRPAFFTVGGPGKIAPVTFHAFRWLDLGAYLGATLGGPPRSASAGLVLTLFLMEREGPWPSRVAPPPQEKAREEREG